MEKGREMRDKDSPSQTAENGSEMERIEEKKRSKHRNEEKEQRHSKMKPVEGASKRARLCLAVKSSMKKCFSFRVPRAPSVRAPCCFKLSLSLFPFCLSSLLDQLGPCGRFIVRPSRQDDDDENEERLCKTPILPLYSY